jgi:ADP-dependent NAD(P)H-hydrate dehydratase / NAD(P)H-hydrate epimerase
MKVVSALQMKKLDRRAIQEFGIPGIVLMENAGRATVEVIDKYFSEMMIRKIIVLAGPGNNGGDGLVIGRHLLNRGVDVEAFLLGHKAKVNGDAKVNLELYQKLRPVQELHRQEDLKKLQTPIDHADLIIDAILGTGVNTEVRGLYRDIIEYINSLPTPVVSVDIPSGVDASTGKVLGSAVYADLTVTFGLPKIGLLLHPGIDRVGILEVADISIPPYLVQEENITVELIDAHALFPLLRKRDRNSHKGNYGHVLMIAGSVGKTGAAALSSDAALRIGAGLVTLGIPASLNPIMEVKLTEVMTEPLAETDTQTLSTKSLPRIQELTEGKKVLALGPGISTHPETIAVVHHIIRNCRIPLIVDADGINILGKKLSVLHEVQCPIVLTPHPGEMARLTGISIEEVQGDRIGVAKKFAQEYGVVLVLKGARTIIAEPNGNIYINSTGNPGMASGGTGDVLTGMIAGLIAQGYTISEASRLGVFLHGYIADQITEQRGEAGLTATDIINRIPLTLKEVMSGNGAFG